MKRAKTWTTCIALLMGAVMTQSNAGEPTRAQRKPNILFIMADDLASSDVVYNGAEFYETPKIDALCKSGMKFSSAYPGAANCIPSRACNMSGMYTSRTKLWTPGKVSKGDPHLMKVLVPNQKNRLGDGKSPTTGKLDSSVVSLAQMLKQADKKTLHLGKWHLGTDRSLGFDRKEIDGRGAGLAMDHKFYGDQMWNGVKTAKKSPPLRGGETASPRRHLPQISSPRREAITRSTTSTKAGSKPFTDRTGTTTADVIVYGSTPGGFCAAIAAAREGASVILLEPTDHVGAMNTGGLSHCDSNQMVRSTLMGLFDEWHTRVAKDYTDRGLKAPYNPAMKDQSLWTFEPHVAMRVTMKMLDQAGVTVLTERFLKSVTKDGPRITSLITKNGTFTARVFVDGTYEGDLMAAAGVDWTIGREGRDEYGESLAGKQYPKKKMKIDGFDVHGKPLPLITAVEAGAEEAGDKKVMTYSFRLCLTEDPGNRVTMPKPTNYDPARFEIVRRALQAGEKRVGFDRYPLPGRKLDGNNSIGGQFSIGLIGGGNNWHSADEVGRKKIWEAHKQYTLEFFHFLTTDPAVPAAIRNRYVNLGLCKDEFASYDHFSPALYVRESRRMKGLYVISQKDILESPVKDDPIAISSFPIDSHDCQRVALRGGGVINEGTIFPVRRTNPKQGYPYHVPYRSILPKPEQCDNLLVPVALSCTHVGISSLRIEAAWMVIGQGAGIAAALAADQDVQVQRLDYKILRKRLMLQKQVLDLPPVSDVPSAAGSIAAKTLPGIVLDDADAKLTGLWSRSTNFKPYIDNGYIFSGERDSKALGDGIATATFRLKAPKSGRYQVLMAYSADDTRAKNVPMSVRSGTQSKTIVVDQTAQLPIGNHFRLIDTVDLQADTETVIQISNENTTGFVIVDALQLLPIE